MNKEKYASHQPLRCSRRRRMAFVLIAWAGLFGLVEGAARVYIPMRGHDLVEIRDAFARRREKRLAGTWADRVQDHPYLPYCPKVSPPDVEMRGLRRTTAKGGKPDDVFRIFCMGGSTTYGGYPAKLEAALSTHFAEQGLTLEVVNASDVSWTSAETLIDFLFRCLSFQPDAVILYHGVNDVWPAFGGETRADYAHWRTRLIPNEPLTWDYLPRVLEKSAAFVQMRAWAEAGSRPLTWKRAIMRYVPDFRFDLYHGVEPYRTNMAHLITIARSRQIPVLLATHVFNVEFPTERYLMALKEINDITRSLADEANGVALVDAAEAIKGTYENMFDVCHFRTDRDGETQLVELLGEAVRTHLPDWIAVRRPTRAFPEYLAADRPVVQPLGTE